MTVDGGFDHEQLANPLDLGVMLPGRWTRKLGGVKNPENCHKMGPSGGKRTTNSSRLKFRRLG